MIHMPESERIALEAEGARVDERIERDYRHNGPHDWHPKADQVVGYVDREAMPLDLGAAEYPLRLNLWPPEAQHATVHIGPGYERSMRLYVRHEVADPAAARACVAAWTDFWSGLTGEVYDALILRAHYAADIHPKPLFED